IDRIMNTPDVQVDTERALSRIRERVERERIAPVISAPRAPRAPAVSLWVKGLAAAASVAIIAVLLTVSGVAETILTIFAPKQVGADARGHRRREAVHHRRPGGRAVLRRGDGAGRRHGGKSAERHADAHHRAGQGPGRAERRRHGGAAAAIPARATRHLAAA